MFDNEDSKHESENGFDENEDNKIENLDEPFKGIELESYQFESSIKNYEKSQEGSSQTQKENICLIIHWENLRVRKIEWCACKKCRAESREIDCLCRREVDTISDEKFSGNICDVLRI